MLDIRTFRGPDCDTNHYFLPSKFKGRLTVSKWAIMNMDMERFIVRKLKEHYQVTIKSKYAALENLRG
jgi:hypothetical protein